MRNSSSFAGLEQFVARQGLDDVAQRLAAVAVRIQARLSASRTSWRSRTSGMSHGRRLYALEVYRPRNRCSDTGRSLLASNSEHADVIHVAGAVHRGARVGLGQDQRHRPETGLRHVMRRPTDFSGRGLTASFLVAQQAQAGGLVGHQTISSLAFLLDHGVFAVAEEGEMVVRGPAQELLRLGTRLGLADGRHS